MLRSAAAIVVGFVFMWATILVGTIVAGTHLVPGLLIRVIGAVFGGWLTARTAGRAPLAHAAVLAAVVGLIAILSGTAASAVPIWYAVTAGVLGAAGVLAGGWLRAAASA
jgi:hypothetical protein